MIPPTRGFFFPEHRKCPALNSSSRKRTWAGSQRGAVVCRQMSRRVLWHRGGFVYRQHWRRAGCERQTHQGAVRCRRECQRRSVQLELCGRSLHARVPNHGSHCRGERRSKVAKAAPQDIACTPEPCASIRQQVLIRFKYSGNLSRYLRHAPRNRSRGILGGYASARDSELPIRDETRSCP